MDITQDDLRFLSLLRAAWDGEAGQRAAEASLRAEPGRAAGRVAAWSLRRSVEALRCGARRPLAVGTALAPSADEQCLVLAARCLARGDHADAAETLRWLARTPFAAEVADRLTEAACAVHGYAAPRRQKAASA